MHALTETRRRTGLPARLGITGLSGRFLRPRRPRGPELTNGKSEQDALGARRSISSRRWESMSIENIIIIVVIVLIVLFVLGYFGRGRFRR